MHIYKMQIFFSVIEQIQGLEEVHFGKEESIFENVDVLLSDMAFVCYV